MTRLLPLLWIFELFFGGIAQPGTRAAGDDILLRLHGSNAIGANIAPAMAEAFLINLGATQVRHAPAPNLDESIVEGVLPGESRSRRIEIRRNSSDAAFTDLAAGKCDVGMSAREITNAEYQTLAALGDMKSTESEHVIGLDGVAIIVSKSNPVHSLSKLQIEKIFSGEIRQWKDVGGRGRDIHVFARDDKSATFDAFQSIVLGGRSLFEGATRMNDSHVLAKSVESDSEAIGFVDLPNVLPAKALGIADSGTRAVPASRTTVATEDYPLTRRLVLYSASEPKNPMTAQFVEFAVSSAGQRIVDQSGFVGQIVATEGFPIPHEAPTRYRNMTSGARRLGVTFRFQPGGDELDNKSQVDLARVAHYLEVEKIPARKVMLFGFCDNSGTPVANDKLANDNAGVVASALSDLGFEPGVVDGFGSALPVVSNLTGEGRARNRRVEIWIRK